jgi:hypothetical protein
MNLKFALLAVAALSVMGGAQATTYRWTWTSAGHSNGAQPGGGTLDYSSYGGAINTIFTEFNTTTNQLKYEVEFNTTATNAYWLAMSPGANPKGYAGELALFYMDASTSTPVLTAYGYNGNNGDNSYVDGSQIGGTQAPDLILSSKNSTSWINNLQVTDAGGKRTMKFDINATAVNNHVPLYPGPGGIAEWTGAEFGNKIGIWFHQVQGAQTTYHTSGPLTGGVKTFSYSKQGYLDGSNLQTVPEPATMTALALGLAAIARKRKSK